MSGFLLKPLVYLSAGIWVTVLALMGLDVPEGFWQPAGFVSLAVTGITLAYDRWWWAWIPLRVSGLPDLRGTWQGSIESMWQDPDTGARPAPIEAYFVVRQTASSISLAMMTNESRSATLTAKLQTVDGAVEIVGVYRNEPKASVQDRSPIHFGGLRLRVGGPPPDSLSGEYWTSRLSKGDLTLERCTRTLADDFPTAQALCGA